MKTNLLIILLSINLIFSGCSSKSINTDTPSATSSSETPSHSVGERVLFGTLVVGAGALILTSIAVAILLLVPKAQVQR
jgi:hypothetical protein